MVAIRGPKQVFSAGISQQGLELGVGGGIVDMVPELAEPLRQALGHVDLAGVGDQRREPRFT